MSGTSESYLVAGRIVPRHPNFNPIGEVANRLKRLKPDNLHPG